MPTVIKGLLAGLAVLKQYQRVADVSTEAFYRDAGQIYDLRGGGENQGADGFRFDATRSTCSIYGSRFTNAAAF